MPITVTVFSQRQIQVRRVNISSFTSDTLEKHFRSSIGSFIILKLIQVQGRSPKNRIPPQYTKRASNSVMITRRTQQVICHFWAQVFNDPLLPSTKIYTFRSKI
ncbi:hypothetical protein NC651_034097 [Populus alba x Populus x berolinensis]|nr:hypothetical protein NC651_034097 [Populus alba x Populus x berolinensis]